MASLKARDIQAKLQSNTDPKIVNILCALAERDDVTQKQLVQMAEAYDRLVNMFSTVLAGVKGMHTDAENLKKRLGLISATDSVKSMSEDDDQSNATRFMDEKK
jgi:DNA-binding transcriptional regulator PaaX